MPSNPPVTIKHIAATLGMSHSTVSRALNGRLQISEDTRKRVREAAARLGYIPNQSARQIRGDAGLQIGLLIPDVQNDFFSNIAKVLADLCRQAGLRLLLGITEDDPATEENEIRGLLEARVGGMLVTLTSSPTAESLTLLNSTICVQLTARTPEIAGAAVCMADEQGCRDATAHLLDLGHRRIAFLGPSDASSIGGERLRGYLRAHREFGTEALAGGTELVAPRQEQGVEAARRLLALEIRPTAMLVASSELTLGALKAIQEAGLRIPDGISVVGYGDARWCELLTPPLTTVRLPVTSLAQEAAKELFAQLNDGSGNVRMPSTLRLGAELVVRGSTAPVA